ncbi:MAG: hypothetical protein JXA95_16865 [Spirochaetales bacterium]|nr:hypothetical protein [Spirochaetales bacterium]
MRKGAFWAQFLGVLFVIILISLIFGRSLIFVSDYRALGFLLLFMLIPVIFVYGAGPSVGFFRTAFDREATDREKKRAIGFFNAMAVYTFLASLLIALATLCFMFGNMKDLDTIGPFIDVEVVTPVYGLIIVLAVFLPLKFYLEQSLEED